MLERSVLERSEVDWDIVEVRDNVFRSRGGPGNLLEMIELFMAFVEDQDRLSADLVVDRARYHDLTMC